MATVEAAAAKPGPDGRRRRSTLENQILWAIFGEESGELIEDFSCAYEKTFLMHGTVFIDSRFVSKIRHYQTVRL
jgi:hypothetical protein